MKSLLFNQFTVVYFLLVLVTHFLIRRGRQDFIAKRKISFLIMAVASAVLSSVFLVYFSFLTSWWMLICLFNLGILEIIAVDVLIIGMVRSLMGFGKLRLF